MVNTVNNQVVSFIDYVKATAPNYKLDPIAVIAIATQEGISGRIGDNGHAFGPFQLNDAGGSFPGSLMNLSAAEKNAWAWSTEGIDYALQQMSQVASGLTGSQAITAIATKFERPRADLLPGEISGAIAQYPTIGGGTITIPSPPTQLPASGNPQTTTQPSTGTTSAPSQGLKLGSIGPYNIVLPSGFLLVLWSIVLLIIGSLLVFGGAFKSKVQVNVKEPKGNAA